MDNKKTQLTAYLRSLLNLHSELDVDAAMSSIRKNVYFRGINVWILACAIIIASLGLNVNSTAVIIGAMLISPLMGPIIGLGLALGTNDGELIKVSLRNLGMMVLISILASTLFFFISPLNMQNPSELLARTNPTIYDVLIAFFGGLAGALETARKDKGTVIAGVAIATALMPPLCTVGYGLSSLNMGIAFGAFYLFFINCTFVAIATFIVVKALGFPIVHFDDPVKHKKIKLIVAALMTLLVVPSVFSAINVIRDNNFNLKASKLVSSNRNVGGATIYDYRTNTSEKPPRLTLYLAGNAPSSSEMETLLEYAQEVCGINRYQIDIEEAFTNPREAGEFEKQVYSDMHANISNLKARLAEYESLSLPHEAVRKEVGALFPQVDSIALARGENDVIAIVKYKPADAESRDSVVSVAGPLKSWLEIRLAGENVSVVETVD